MKTTKKRNDGGWLLVPDARGFTLVEVMIALVISIVAAMGIYSMLATQKKQYSSQNLYSGLQRDLRFSLDYMKDELILAGYRAVENPTQPITVAGTNTITFEYWDDNAELYYTLNPGYDNHIKVKYELNTGTGQLLRRMYRYHTTAGYDASPVTQVLAEDVEQLAFNYFVEDNVAYDSGTHGLDDIRSVRIRLTGKSGKPDPILKDPTTGGAYYHSLTLQAEVRPRNISVSSSPDDTTPPATPGQGQGVAGFNFYDPGVCGTLELRWLGNTEPDLKGYTIYYGLISGEYAQRVTIARPPVSSGAWETYTLTGLDSTEEADPALAMYYVSVQAIDLSGNRSALGPEISGNPIPSVNVAGGASDTTANPALPAAPSPFTASVAGGENQIDLTWTAPAVTGLAGYRLYRSTAGPDFTPTGTATGQGNCIADENYLPDGAVSYTDTGLLGCQTYYYKICAINCVEDLFDDYTTVEFASAYGDGPGLMADYPAGANSTPIDNTPPKVPVLAAKPGYRRIILSLVNTDHGTDPDFVHTRVYYSTVGYPAIDTGGVVTPSTVIPDNDTGSPGAWAGTGTLPAINFDNETLVYPPEPSLQADVTYYFLAVSFDQCGNFTQASAESLAEGQQCGDCTVGELCYDAPPAPSNVQAEGCNDFYLSLWWDPIDDIDYRDLAGFRVSRREGPSWASGDPATEVELTGADPIWPNYFVDTYDKGLEEGKVYSYRIRSTDCYWEQHHGAVWPDPANDPNDNYADTFIEGLYVGRIDEDPARREVLTGDLTLSPPTYRHNTVTFFVRNTAPGTLSLREFSYLAWENPLAYLAKVEAGDGLSTPAAVLWEDGGSPLTRSYTGSNVYLGDWPVDGLDDAVPVTLTFMNADRSVDSNTNMRQDLVDLGLTYVNDATGTDYCSVYGSVYIPLGPVVSTVTQNKPSFGTLSWAVPGPTGGNTPDAVVVPGATEVAVFTKVQNTSAASLASVTLYYYVDTTDSLTAAPADIGDYTPIAMAAVAGTLWRTPVGGGIPASDGAGIWYWLLAVDSDGNFDRSPEIHGGAYQYYQQVADVCDNTPEAPALSGSYDASGVTLTWTKPVLNTDGSNCLDLAGYNVYRSVDGGSWTLLQSIADPDTLAYVDSPADLDTANYSYYVSAYDTCAPTAIESAGSGIFTECGGAPDCILTLTPPAGSAINPGDTFSVDLTICARQNGVPAETVFVQTCAGTGDADSVVMTETGDTGAFSISAAAYGGRNQVTAWLAGDYPSVPGDLDLRVNPNDTIVVGAWSDTAYTNDVCEAPHTCSDQTLDVATDPCASPAVPAAPAVTGVSMTGSRCNRNNNYVVLDWSPPAGAPVDYYRVYRCESAGCTPAIPGDLLADNVTAATYTDSAPGGKLNGRTLRYVVTAVNTIGGLCSAVEGPPSSPVAEDPCP